MTHEQVIKALPKGETLWVVYVNNTGTVSYIITSKRDSRDFYFAYFINGDKLEKLGRARSPVDLEGKFIYKDKGT